MHLCHPPSHPIPRRPGRTFTVFVLCAAAAFAAADPPSPEPTGEWVRQVEFANELVDRGELDGAERIYKTALTQAHLAGDDLRAAVVFQNLGRLLDRKGQTLEAEKAYLRAIGALTRSDTKDDKLFVRAYAGLAVVYLQSGQLAKAENLIRRGLADHPAAAAADRASLAGSLGVVLARKGRFEEAEQVFRQTAEECAGHPSEEVREAGAVAVANLAALQMLGGRADEAAELYRKALATMDELRNAYPTTLAATLSDYAGALRAKGDRDGAERLYRRAIETAETRLGPAHPVLGGLLEKLSELLRESGKKSEARTLANAARRIGEEAARANLTGHSVAVEALKAGK